MTEPSALAVSFAERVKMLGKLGVEFHQEYDYGKQGTEERHQFDVPLFTNVHLPFTPQDWVSLCMNEGEMYIGGCCGTTSAMQDIVDYTFRFSSGWFECRKLAELAELAKGHDEDKTSAYLFSRLKKPLSDAVEDAARADSDLTPWQRMALIWHVVDGHYRLEVPSAHLPERRHTGDADLSIAASGLEILSYGRMWSHNEPPSPQLRPLMALTLARLLPAVTRTLEKLKELYEGPFDGLALIDKNRGPDEIAENGRGYCIFSTRAEVDELLGIWREQEQAFEERSTRTTKIDERIGVRPVRITLEKGIEFLDV